VGFADEKTKAKNLDKRQFFSVTQGLSAFLLFLFYFLLYYLILCVGKLGKNLPFLSFPYTDFWHLSSFV